MSKQKHFFYLKQLANNVWGLIRDEIVAKKHKRIADFWQPIIVDYFDGKIQHYTFKPKKQIQDKVIWQYWGQQTDGNALPPVVQRCFDSVDKYKDDYQVIRLNDCTVKDYLDFPEFIWQANGELKFSRVFFSDLIRLALLQAYGGVWLDATILLTAPLPEEFTEQEYFVFQRSDEEPNKTYWAGPHTSYWSWNSRYRVKMLNSVIFAKNDSKMIVAMLDLILHYWKSQDKIIDYFFFQVLYHELINNQLNHLQCTIVSDTLPHILRVMVDGGNYMSLQELLSKVSIHKLTYFDEPRISRLDGFIKEADRFRQNT